MASCVGGDQREWRSWGGGGGGVPWKWECRVINRRQQEVPRPTSIISVRVDSIQKVHAVSVLAELANTRKLRTKLFLKTSRLSLHKDDPVADNTLWIQLQKLARESHKKRLMDSSLNVIEKTSGSTHRLLK